MRLIRDVRNRGISLVVIEHDVLVDAIGRIHDEGTTIFVVEQDVAVAFNLATTGYVTGERAGGAVRTHSACEHARLPLEVTE